MHAQLEKERPRFSPLIPRGWARRAAKSTNESNAESKSFAFACALVSPLDVSRCIGAAVLQRLLVVHNDGRMPMLLLSTSRGVEYASSRTPCAIWNVQIGGCLAWLAWWQSVSRQGLASYHETKVTKCAQAVETPEGFLGSLTLRLLDSIQQERGCSK